MNKTEATIILNIMATADGRCMNCARDLFRAFCAKFPKRERLAQNIFEQHFGRDLVIYE